MKKPMLFAVRKTVLISLFAFVMSIALVSCGGISKDKAVDIALKSMGTSKVYVQKWEVEFDKASNVYQVTAWREGKHVFRINAKNGTIISSEVTPEV